MIGGDSLSQKMSRIGFVIDYLDVSDKTEIEINYLIEYYETNYGGSKA